MGKDEDKPVEEPEEDKTDSDSKTTTPAAPEPDSSDEKTSEQPPVETPLKTEEKEEETKKDAEDIRRVIKLDSTEDTKTDEKPAEPPVEKTKEPSEENEDLAGLDDIADSGPTDSRENLEQKRAILQNIKDFDFQIKKNQEDIDSMTQKLDGFSKDLDDLVSLYEIVSEQMNPFVGLSKVTKKRIDALENFTREMEEIKDRTAELESFAEQSGAKFKNLGEQRKAPAKTIDTEAILGESDGEGAKTDVSDEVSGEIPNEEQQIESETNESEKNLNATPSEEKTGVENIATEETTENEEVIKNSKEVIDTIDETSPGAIQKEEPQQQPIQLYNVYNNVSSDLSDADLDKILEMALGGFSPEGKLDMVIDEFIESLKG